MIGQTISHNKILEKLGEARFHQRHYEEAKRYLDLYLSLLPDHMTPYCMMAWTFILWTGDTQKARTALDEMPEKIDDASYVEWFIVELYERRYQAALDRLGRIPGELFEDYGTVTPWALNTGMVYRLMGEEERATAAFDSARVLLEREVKERPDDFRIRGPLGMAYAGLGRKDEAIREGLKGVEMLPTSADALVGPDRLIDLAAIYTMVGEYEAALDQIEHLLSVPCRFSVQLLRLDPQWGPLRDHPRFQRLLEEFSNTDS